MQVEYIQKVVDGQPKLKSIKVKLDYKGLEAKIKFVRYKEVIEKEEEEVEENGQ